MSDNAGGEGIMPRGGFQNMTPERRREVARKGGRASTRPKTENMTVAIARHRGRDALRRDVPLNEAIRLFKESYPGRTLVKAFEEGYAQEWNRLAELEQKRRP